jgi:hypothetical protein
MRSMKSLFQDSPNLQPGAEHPSKFFPKICTSFRQAMPEKFYAFSEQNMSWEAMSSFGNAQDQFHEGSR